MQEFQRHDTHKFNNEDILEKWLRAEEKNFGKNLNIKTKKMTKTKTKGRENTDKKKKHKKKTKKPKKQIKHNNLYKKVIHQSKKHCIAKSQLRRKAPVLKLTQPIKSSNHNLAFK
ncbi:hypothetical protein HYD46_02530 [Mycoplasmopsis bovis]|nr:hypothetical protein [Mycoplasmopsis bovis]QQH78242.1 hypothetical protein HYD46_02530 [Mycoplasmopsis bovis]